VRGMRGKNEPKSERARSLRRALTASESALWLRIRNRQLDGFKFVRQEPVGPYYADFICRERRLIVEVDGGQHSDSATDRTRDAALARLGYRVVRFWNSDIAENIEGVLQVLSSELSA
jgi:very-short-patch-repair endonuclease